MNKYKKLGKNTLLMTIGNFGTKILAFLLLPFYTHYMSPELYGELNLITATISVLTPLLTLEFTAGIFRFASGEKTEEKRKILSTSLFFILPILGSSLLILGFLTKYLKVDYLNKYYPLIVLSFIFNFILGILKEYIRADQRIKLYTVSGILVSCITLISNILLVPKYGVEGFIVSGILASLIVSIYLLIKEKFYLIIKLFYFDKGYIKKISFYSLPLIPNAIIWWIIGLSDRFIINYYHSSDMVGLYSVANKFSLLVTTLFGIFYKSLQISALEEYKSKEYKKFFNDIFINISSILLFAIIGLTLIIKFVMKVMVADEFYISWIYVIPLLIATLYNSYSAMLGVNYLATKESKKLLKSSIIAAIFNIGLNFILIPRYDIIGAIIATIISYMILFIVRWKESYKLVELKLNKSFYLTNLIVLIIYFISILEIKIVIQYSLMISMFGLFVFLERSKINYGINLLKKKLKK